MEMAGIFQDELRANKSSEQPTALLGATQSDR